MNPLFIGPIIDIVGKIFDRVIPDKAEAERAKMEFLKESSAQEFQLQLGQLEINKEEAKHQNIFVAGWRPFIGWICGAAMAYTFILYPVMNWIIEIVQPSFTAPALDTGNLMELVIGMLGMAGLRTFEKWKQVSKS